MTIPLLKPAYPPYITPSELAVMLDQAGGGGTKWTSETVLATLQRAGAVIHLPVAPRTDRAARPTKGKGARFATTYELLQRNLPDIHRALLLAAPADDIERLLAPSDG